MDLALARVVNELDARVLVAALVVADQVNVDEVRQRPGGHLRHGRSEGLIGQVVHAICWGEAAPLGRRQQHDVQGDEQELITEWV